MAPGYSRVTNNIKTKTLTSECSGGFPPSVALTTIVYLPPSTKSDRAGWIIVSSPGDIKIA